MRFEPKGAIKDQSVEGRELANRTVVNPWTRGEAHDFVQTVEGHGASRILVLREAGPD